GRLLLLPGAAAAATAEAGTGPLRRARFRTPMAREVTFPRTRHVALSGLEQGGEAKATGSEAILVPIRVAAQVTPPAGGPLPPAGAGYAGEAVLLGGLDRWSGLGPEGAGYCRSCELALVEYLREAYGDHLEPFDALEEMRSSTLPRRERPFSRQKQALRLLESVEAAKRSILRARDEARRQRSVE